MTDRVSMGLVGNTGSADIKGLAIWIIGEKGTKLFDLDNALIKKGGLYKKSDREVNYDASLLGRIKQVQFIPKIQPGQTAEICPKNAVKVEKIEACS